MTVAIEEIPMWVANARGHWHVCAWREMQGDVQSMVMTACGTWAWGWPRHQTVAPAAKQRCPKCMTAIARPCGKLIAKSET